MTDNVIQFVPRANPDRPLSERQKEEFNRMFAEHWLATSPVGRAIDKFTAPDGGDCA